MAAGRGALVEAWYRGDRWLWLLRPVEFLFRALAGLRRSAYHHGVWRSYRAPCPVVIVGNITVGGTGKTPIVIALVEALQRAGCRPGVVSRGYGARSGQYPCRVSATSEARDCGDEALMIHRRTGCPCVVDPDRAAAVAELTRDGAVDIVLSDDGLQHYGLARDLELAVLDASAGIGNGFCLPAGPLREPAARLAQVDFLLYRGGDDPATGVTYRPTGLVNVLSGEQRPFAPAALGSAIYALAGIGQPEQFFNTLRQAGFQPQARVFPDHHAYSRADLADLGDRPLIMTEKDAVKCHTIAAANAWFLRIEAQLPEPVLAAVLELARRPTDTEPR
jgi:tetraacyldisaccharide 4'-kinase